jgi:hypothetical protein
MIVGDLDVVSAVVLPHEADAPPVVDPDAVLPRAAASEQLEAVPGRDPQVRERRRGIQLHELAEPHTLQVRREAVVTPDGRGYAYEYRRIFHKLFLVEGLK